MAEIDVAALEECLRLVAEPSPVEEIWMHPDDFVAAGGVLPPNRPTNEPACIHLRNGVAEWMVPE